MSICRLRDFLEGLVFGRRDRLLADLLVGLLLRHELAEPVDAGLRERLDEELDEVADDPGGQEARHVRLLGYCVMTATSAGLSSTTASGSSSRRATIFDEIPSVSAEPLDDVRRAVLDRIGDRLREDFVPDVDGQNLVLRGAGGRVQAVVDRLLDELLGAHRLEDRDDGSGQAPEEPEDDGAEEGRDDRRKIREPGAPRDPDLGPFRDDDGAAGGDDGVLSEDPRRVDGNGPDDTVR